MASNHYFDFLGTVWEQLPSEDKERLGETWQGYEQVFAAAYQKFAEASINVAIKDLLPFNTERWLPYEFNESNKLSEPSIFTSFQDLSLGINLTVKSFLRFSVDGATAVEVDVRGIDPANTSITEIIEKINVAFGFVFSKAIFENTVVQLTSPTSGVNSSIEFLVTADPARNASEFILGLLDSELPLKIPEFPHTYTLPYSKVPSVPKLRDAIRDESLEVEIAEGVDYEVLNQRTISFAVEPLEKMWAKRTLFDEETPFNNYGFLMDIFQPTSQRYVEVLQGLWFAFWTGPKPSNVRTSLYLLFGLPTSRFEGTVTEVTASDITLTSTLGAVEVFEIPSGLNAIVAVGDTVSKFDPLVDGIEVFDKINKPGFIKDEIGREGIQRFLTEKATRGSGEDTDETKALRTLEEYTFLPQISVEAFISPDINLGNVKIFLEAIKPLNKTFLFQVIVGSFRDPVDFKETHTESADIDVTPNVDSNETTFQDNTILDDYETVDNAGLNLDSNGILFQEKGVVEVRSFGSLIDTFNL